MIRFNDFYTHITKPRIFLLRFWSTADILAQALDVLNGIVGEDEGRGLFLKYKALTAILAVLRTGSPGLLAPSLDVLLHMSTESREFHNTNIFICNLTQV